MFVSQAALVIANARRPPGRAAGQGRAGNPDRHLARGRRGLRRQDGSAVSFNREAVRIIQNLRTPDSAPEQILEALTVRRADGREVSLAEFPFAQLLSAGETVRAEEIVMRTPDGRSVTALVNATPIRSEDGEVESFVVTLQDMTAQEELERLRAEFLAMVSHELRMPLSSIKGSAATVLGAPSSLDPAEAVQFFRIIDTQADRMHDLIGGLLDVARIETGTLPVNPEPSDAASLVDEAKSAFLSGGEGSNLRIDLPPDLPPVMADRPPHRPGAGQPAFQRGQALPRVPHPRDGGAGGRPRRVLRRRRGQRFVGGPPAASVQEVLPHRRRGPGERHCGVGGGACHLQGDSGGARGPHLGRERRAGPRRAVHLHDSGGGGGKGPEARAHRLRPPSAPAGRRGSRRAYSRWTTTPRRSGTFATPSPRRATRPSSPATRRTCRASWRRRSPPWSCWT